MRMNFHSRVASHLNTNNRAATNKDLGDPTPHPAPPPPHHRGPPSLPQVEREPSLKHLDHSSRSSSPLDRLPAATWQPKNPAFWVFKPFLLLGPSAACHSCSLALLLFFLLLRLCLFCFFIKLLASPRPAPPPYSLPPRPASHLEPVGSREDRTSRWSSTFPLRRGRTHAFKFGEGFFCFFPSPNGLGLVCDYECLSK